MSDAWGEWSSEMMLIESRRVEEDLSIQEPDVDQMTKSLPSWLEKKCCKWCALRSRDFWRFMHGADIACVPCWVCLMRLRGKLGER